MNDSHVAVVSAIFGALAALVPVAVTALVRIWHAKQELHKEAREVLIEEWQKVLSRAEARTALMEGRVKEFGMMYAEQRAEVARLRALLQLEGVEDPGTAPEPPPESEAAP